MAQNVSRINWGTGGGLGAILLWSATFALARSLSERVGPLTAGAAVYLVGGSLGLLRLVWLGRPLGLVFQLPRKYLLGCGLLFVLYTALIYAAVGQARDREQLLEVALINYLWPAASILLSLPLLRQRGSLLLLPGTALALIGVFLVMTQGAQVSWASFRDHLQATRRPTCWPWGAPCRGRFTPTSRGAGRRREAAGRWRSSCWPRAWSCWPCAF